MQTTTNEILKGFAAISLKEMDGVKLMDRTDTKFTFSMHRLDEILRAVQPHYYCLEIASTRSSRYQTLYYDTSDLMLYLKHHNGGLNRYKIRHRSYLDSGTSFVEIKFKNNKGRTIKNRVKTTGEACSLNESSVQFLRKSLPFSPDVLQPVVWVNYSRITLVSRTGAERVTIDINLEFEKNGSRRGMEELVIAEVKQDRKTPSVFLQHMRSLHIREGSISKYCFAIACMYPGVKKNSFKEKLLSLKQIVSHDVFAGVQ